MPAGGLELRVPVPAAPLLTREPHTRRATRTARPVSRARAVQILVDAHGRRPAAGQRVAIRIAEMWHGDPWRWAERRHHEPIRTAAAERQNPPQLQLGTVTHRRRDGAACSGATSGEDAARTAAGGDREARVERSSFYVPSCSCTRYSHRYEQFIPASRRRRPRHGRRHHALCRPSCRRRHERTDLLLRSADQGAPRGQPSSSPSTGTPTHSRPALPLMEEGGARQGKTEANLATASLL